MKGMNYTFEIEQKKYAFILDCYKNDLCFGFTEETFEEYLKRKIEEKE